MLDDISAEDTQVDQTTDTSVGGDEQASQQEQPPAEGGGGNPAWDSIRSELGDVVFHRIEPHLKQFDQNHDRQVSKLNEKYGWARDLEASGVTPEHVQAAVSLAKALDETPEQVYERLGEFLRNEGRMPNSAAELEAKTEDPDDDGDEDDDPRIAQLRQQQEEMREFLIQQEQERVARESDAALDTEIDALKQAHPEFGKEDLHEIINRAYARQVQTGQQVPLEVAAQEYLALRERFLSAPRPGDSAPRLVPTSGGNAAVAQQKNYGDMDRGEVQDMIAALVAQDKEKP